MSKPIPIPFKQRWQEFRIQALPFVVCGIALVGVVFLWQEQAAPQAMTGEVEALASEVIAPGAGMVAQLTVDRFDYVEAGTVLGQVMTTPPDVLHASLAVLQAEINLTRLGWIDPLLDQQRNELQVESLKLDWLEKASGAAIQRIELEQAKREYDRMLGLRNSQVVSEGEYELVQSRVEVLTKSVEEQERIAGEMERVLGTLRINRSDDDFAPAALRATLALQEERLRLAEAQLRPRKIVAPMSGHVMLVHRRNGEQVREGEPILTIQSPQSERIIAYFRQPINFEPTVGMKVEIMRRNSSKERVSSEVLFVGPQIESLGESFRRPYVEHYETGLPVVVAVPPHWNVRPGELVDVSLRP